MKPNMTAIITEEYATERAVELSLFPLQVAYALLMSPILDHVVAFGGIKSKLPNNFGCNFWGLLVVEY